MANIQFQVRRGTAAEWVAVNPILSAGEPGYETDTNFLKIGDGITSWSSLAYLGVSNLGGYPLSVSSLSDGDVLVFSQAQSSWIKKNQSELVDGGVY